ncbi:MAG: Asp-tRNA(Asn)/Glu-tRNA(Gln) amidotransferase subunit GatC [Burkholderiales bacterium]|jgi:aspartyl-tRNA(Asn)/glutamyl-tRNA(Gln) amidotransferase subunit C|nr:Asp-tRNA(Asn)/Glu-tRNA(Gln) amidotransferase subunit GatC [Burkholderiales bacterium]
MELSEADLRRIAHLARLELGDADLLALHRTLTSIFNMIDDLSRPNTDDIAPMAHAQPITLPLRDDVVNEPNTVEHRNHYQRGAPAVEKGLFLVPKVIE